jgi:hypothetical protein
MPDRNSNAVSQSDTTVASSIFFYAAHPVFTQTLLITRGPRQSDIASLSRHRQRRWQCQTNRLAQFKFHDHHYGPPAANSGSQH